MTHIVLYGEAGQELRHPAPVFVSAATYKIIDARKAQSDPTRVIDSGAATTPAWTLTLDGAAGPDQADATQIPVAATSGPEIGDAAEIVSSDGASEPITIAAIELDDYVSAGSFLAGAYSGGEIVRGRTISAPVPAGLYDFEAALDDQRPLMIEWAYTIGNTPVRVPEPIQLSRQSQAAVVTGPALHSLLRGWPDLAGRILAGLTLGELAGYSAEQLEGDLVAQGIDPPALMLGVQGRLLLVAKILHEAAIRGYSPGMRPLDAFVAEREREYTVKLEAVTAGRAGTQAIKLDTEAVAHERPDTTYRGALSAM